MNPLTLRMTAFQVLVLLALAFGTLAWIARPEGAIVWITGMATLPFTWLGLQLFGAMPPKDCPEQRRIILNSLIVAGLLVAGALGACALGLKGAIPEDWITRYAMITNALVMIVIGNGLPKKAEPGCSPTRGLAVQRLLGWTFVVGGCVQALTWMLTPSTDETMAIVTFGIFAAMGTAIATGLWRIRSGAADGSSAV